MLDTAIDVHQHLWPDELVDRLRRPDAGRRTCAAGRCTPTANRRTTWTRRTRRRGPDRRGPRGGGGHRLPQPLRAARDRGAAAPRGRSRSSTPGTAGSASCPDHFRAWASVPVRATPTSTGCAACSATTASSACSCRPPTCSRPFAWERLGRGAARRRGRRQAGVRAPRAESRAAWSTATCPAGGRRWSATPRSCRRPGGAGTPFAAGRCSRGCGCCFGAGAGLAPVHHERHALRGGTAQPVDPDVFVDTSGTGPRALEAVVRVLGIDALVLGSDRPVRRRR